MISISKKTKYTKEEPFVLISIYTFFSCKKIEKSSFTISTTKWKERNLSIDAMQKHCMGMKVVRLIFRHNYKVRNLLWKFFGCWKSIFVCSKQHHFNIMFIFVRKKLPVYSHLYFMNMLCIDILTVTWWRKKNSYDFGWIIFIIESKISYKMSNNNALSPCQQICSV